MKQKKLLQKKSFAVSRLLVGIFACGLVNFSPVHAAEPEQIDDLTETTEEGNNVGEVIDLVEPAEIEALTQDEMPMPEEPEVQLVSRTMAEDQDLIWIGWTFYESSTKSWVVAGGDGGRAFGRYQFDAHSSLAPFMKFCLAENETNYGAFNSFISSKNDTEVRNLGSLPTTWKTVYTQNSDEFSLLQTDFAVEYYYSPVKQRLLELYGINLDNYSPVLKGTVWSITVRDGRTVSLKAKNNNLRSVTDSYLEILAADGTVDEEKWLNRIYDLESQRHPGQKSRWNEKQRQAALGMLTLLKQLSAAEDVARSAYEIMQLSSLTDTAGQPEILFEVLALPNVVAEPEYAEEVMVDLLALNG